MSNLPDLSPRRLNELALEAARLDDAEMVQLAHAALLRAGYRSGPASGSPLSFLSEFFENKAAPWLRHHGKLLTVTTRETLSRMRAEGFAGPVTFGTYAHIALGDAIRKSLSSDAAGGISWSSLGGTDWFIITTCFLMWLRAHPDYSELWQDIERSMRDDQ